MAPTKNEVDWVNTWHMLWTTDTHKSISIKPWRGFARGTGIQWPACAHVHFFTKNNWINKAVIRLGSLEFGGYFAPAVSFLLEIYGGSKYFPTKTFKMPAIRNYVNSPLWWNWRSCPFPILTAPCSLIFKYSPVDFSTRIGPINNKNAKRVYFWSFIDRMQMEDKLSPTIGAPPPWSPCQSIYQVEMYILFLSFLCGHITLKQENNTSNTGGYKSC